jgi:hypothetical protein
MPEQRSGFRALLPMGPYRFRFPQLRPDSECWDTMKLQSGGDRLNVIFEGALGLLVVQSPGNEHNGETFETRISAAERNRARHGEPEQLVSDWDYVLRDVFDVKARPKTNLQYAQVIMQVCNGKEMTADIEWSWWCNPKNDIRVEDGQGGQTVVENQKGCNARYYAGGKNGVQKVLSDPNDPKSALVYPERVICSGKDGIPCGASVRAFANLRSFRK